MPSLALVAPLALAVEPPLDAPQGRAADAVATGVGNVAIVGVPGAGKTAVAVAGAARAVAAGLAPERVLVIAPTRVAAALLRDRVSAAMGRPTGSPVVRTAASAAYAVLAARARIDEMPPPALVTGAEQDVILRELLAGHAAGEGTSVDWAGVVPEDATALAGFREELRNLLMRAAESGLGPEDVAELARLTQRPEWLAAAQVYEEYDSVMALRGSPGDQGARYDPAAVVSYAADVLEQWDEILDGPRPGWDLVIVDDFHDATSATGRLLQVAAANGARIAVLGNSDESVQGYRGAMPGALGAAARPLGKGGYDAELLTLTEQYRQHPDLAALTQRVADRIGMPAGSAIRMMPEPEATPGDGTRHSVEVEGDGANADEIGSAGSGTDAESRVRVLVAPHRYSQSRAIAAQLRRARHGFDGEPSPWGRMVVIAPSGAQLRELRSDLIAADIPCETIGDALALHREPAVAALLSVVRLALGEEWTEDTALDLLGSRLIGLDAIGIRRLRRALVRVNREEGGIATSADLVIAALESPESLGALGEPEARRAKVAALAVQAGRAAATALHATPGGVLWAVWDALDVSDAWRDAALAGSARDDADLDAVIALMRAAQTFTERMPEARIGQFLEYLEAQDFAADSLGARAVGVDVVSFATPASAAGREWDVVVVAGLDEGVWPNLKLRDSVLGAAHFADIVAGRADAIPLTAESRVVAAHTARKAVLDDETRALLVAISRARQRLVIACLDGDESRPSRYVSMIEEAAGVERIDATEGGRVADLRAAVATLRTEAQSASADDRVSYARMLANLALLDLPGAHPARWNGVPEPSTELPFWDDDAVVRVSPSRVDAVERCALKWALESAGGRKESTQAQDLGTLIHEIAAALPSGTETELFAEFERRWPDVGGMETWAQRVDYQRARAMIKKLAAYIVGSHPHELFVERDFAVTLGRARLAGQADRVEISDGKARIVDLKTGAAISKSEVVDHGQLAMYQLAANHGAFEGVSEARDASLVFVGDASRVSVNELIQPAIDDSATRTRLDTVVHVMTGATFDATTNSMCDHCPVRRSCPARPTGRQVSEL
ncbi:UrvD/REP family ATP-dependent DNA helicase [Demequina aurantiaca]|uniref:UrvD/REP family ATP-dependent DNA helicase n=1 Tax=Demequina aurantiaca TaxID=676200 RepID=UPI0007843352|nr:UrvD/REP family ATP-dependent DNA helicase [Demequina aurantiaca]